MNEGENTGLRSFQIRLLWISITVVLLLFLAVAISTFFYQDEILRINRWVLEKFGFSFLAALVFFSDTLVSPIRRTLPFLWWQPLIWRKNGGFMFPS